MKYTAFHEYEFRRQVDKALQHVQKILDVTRTPTYAEDQDHTYDDKYALAEFLTNTAVAAQMNVLQHMGLGEEKLRKLSDMVHQEKRSVTLRFAPEDSCSFLKEQVVRVPSHEREYEVETSKQASGLLGFSKNVKETMKTMVSRSITEYHWKVSHSYKLFAFAGNQPDKDPVVLQTRTGSTVIVTSGNNKSPIPEQTVHPPVDVALTWLIQQIGFDKKLSCRFQINRSKDTCCTPLRNEDIEEAVTFFETFRGWTEISTGHFEHRVEGFILGKYSPAGSGDPSTTTKRLHSIYTENIFCPVLPLMETPREGAGTATREEQSKSMLCVRSPVQQDQTSSPLLSIGDVDKFLNEQILSLEEAFDDVKRIFPSTDASKLITVDEASLYVQWKHTGSLCLGYARSIGYIEEMLRKQLIAAIGKQVQPKDFDQFMQFHMNKLFHDAFTPKPFCYAIRRPDHYPDGVVCIETKDHASRDKLEPVNTLVQAIPGETSPPMYFPINAATLVEFTGPRYLHGWIQHRFSASSTHDSLRRAMLTARARQFSSFLLMIGTVAGPDKFNPKDAIIVQNKDEVIIPLLLNELPTAKGFKDAIASLSPEQQRFARSFRGMQLESSVFGVCVVQLKPQFETLLRLPQDSLTKEIQLTQDLMSLFIDYQIPSDLMSYDGPEDAASAEKLTIVKGHVKAVQDVIDKAKKAEMEEATRKAEMSVERHSPAISTYCTFMTDSKLRCALVYRLAEGADPTMIAKYDHASQYETHGGADAGSLYGSRDKNYAEAVAKVIGSDPPGGLSQGGALGGFKVVQRDVHQVVYGSDPEGICMAVITGLNYPSRVAISMLNELYTEFTSRFGDQVKTAQTNALTKKAASLLTSTCKKYEDSAKVDKASIVLSKVDAVKGQMQDNISDMLKNTEKAETLAEKSDQLNEQAEVFKKNSKDLKKQRKTIKRTPARGSVAFRGAPAPPPMALNASPLKMMVDGAACPPMEAAISDKAGVPVPAGTLEPQAVSAQDAITGDLSEGKPRAGENIDFTMIPKELDALFEKQDTDSALRSTIIEAGSSWERTRQENMLTWAAKASLNSDAVKSEKNKAFDLLDALSRSGSLPIACAELHVVVAITHTFEQDIMDTIIQDNINPIEKVEKTYIMMASKIHAGTRAAHLIRGPS